MSIHVRMTPQDVALFRDARPFDANDAAGARLVSYAPTQFAAYGALRQLLLHEANADYGDFRAGRGGSPAAGTSPAEPGQLSIGPVLFAPSPGSSPSALLPAPGDLVHQSIAGWERGSTTVYLHPQPALRAQSNLPAGISPLGPSFRAAGYTYSYESAGLALNSAHLEDYLLGRPISLDPLDAYFLPESRLGIERDFANQTAAEGRIYTVEFARPADGAGYLVPVFDGADELPSDPRILSLGGEHRPCSFQRVESDDIVPPELAATVAERLAATYRDGAISFRLYLLSPVASPAGWRPIFEDPGIEMEAAAVSRPIWLSGWDTAAAGGTGAPKCAQPHIPAGSVFFLKADWGLDPAATAEAILDKFWFRSSLCPSHPFEAKAGLGVTLVGVTNHAQ